VFLNVAFILKGRSFNDLMDKYLEVLNDKVELQKKKMMQQCFTTWRSTVQKEKHAELHKTIKALREEINKLEAADEKACDETIRIVNCSFMQQATVNKLHKQMMMQQCFTSWRSNVQKENLSALEEEAWARDEKQREFHDCLYDEFIKKQAKVEEINVQNMRLMTERAQLLNRQHLRVWMEKMLSDKYDWAVKFFKDMKADKDERLGVMKTQMEFAELEFDCLKDKTHVLQAQCNDVNSKLQLSQLDNAEFACNQQRLEEKLAHHEEVTRERDELRNVVQLMVDRGRRSR
jgi:hypothetical protein